MKNYNVHENVKASFLKTTFNWKTLKKKSENKNMSAQKPKVTKKRLLAYCDI